MNPSKDNFEFGIKEQINSREVAPSRDLWAEIQAQTENAYPKRSSFSWALLAACFILLFSVGSVLYLNQDSEATGHITGTGIKHSDGESSMTVQPEVVNSQKLTVNQKQESVIQAKDTPDDLREKETSQTHELPLLKENSSETASQIIQVQPAKIMAASDSVKVQKRKRYVDPSTLLFSVEHKDVIEKSKGGSHVATIDLNTK